MDKFQLKWLWKVESKSLSLLTNFFTSTLFCNKFTSSKVFFFNSFSHLIRFAYLKWSCKLVVNFSTSHSFSLHFHLYSHFCTCLPLSGLILPLSWEYYTFIYYWTCYPIKLNFALFSLLTLSLLYCLSFQSNFQSPQWYIYTHTHTQPLIYYFLFNKHLLVNTMFQLLSLLPFNYVLFIFQYTLRNLIIIVNNSSILLKLFVKFNTWITFIVKCKLRHLLVTFWS